MRTKAIKNREDFLFKSLFGQTYDELDVEEYEWLIDDIASFEVFSRLNDICDKTGTFFAMTEDPYGDYESYSVLGSGYYGFDCNFMSYEKIGVVDQIDFIELGEEVFFEYSDSELNNLNEKEDFKNLYHFTNFAKYYEFLKKSYIHSNNEIRVNQNKFYSPEDGERSGKEEYLLLTYGIIGENKKDKVVEGLDINLDIPIILRFDENLKRYKRYFLEDHKNRGFFSKVPIPLDFCREIIFKNRQDMELAKRLFASDNIYSVNSSLFIKENFKSEEICSSNNKKQLSLNTSELGIILDSFEIVFTNLDMNDNIMEDENKFSVYHPLERFKKIKEFFEDKRKLSIIIDEKFEKLSLQEFYKAEFKKGLIKLIGDLYYTGLDSYSIFFEYYLLNNNWKLMNENNSEKKDLFIHLFNEYINKNISYNGKSIEGSCELKSKLSSKDVDNAIMILKIVLFLKYTLKYNQEVNIFESLVFQTLYKLILFKRENLDENIIGINDVVLLKNLDSLEYETYMIVKDGNDRTENQDIDKNIDTIKATLASEVGKALYGLFVGDIVELIGRKYKIIDIKKEEDVNNKEFYLKIVDSYITDDWMEIKNINNNVSIANKKYIEETALKQTGYSIWNKNERRTREERWSILMNKSIPELGLSEVIGTIRSHIYNYANKDNAVKEWKFDLDRLKKEFFKIDKIEYFDL